MIIKGSYLFILICFSVIDIRKREVPGIGVVLFGVLGMLVGIGIQFYFKEEIWLFLVFKLCLVAMFFVVGRLTQESFGYGDCWGILGVSTIFSFLKFLSLLCTSFFCLALFGCAVYGLRKIRKWQLLKNMTLPFYPFLTLGFMSCLS